MTEQRCIIYTRFSPRRDEETSESCETQLDICKGFALAREWVIVDWFADRAVSGGDEDKPQLDKAIKALRRGYVLLVYNRDRLARSVLLAELVNREAITRGARIVAVSGDVEGEGDEINMTRQVMASVAELARKQIGRKTSDAMLRHQAAGRRMGRYAPYGYALSADDDGLLVENAQERGAINRIVELRRKRYRRNRIVIFLNEEMPELARSGRWYYKVVNKILEREGIE